MKKFLALLLCFVMILTSLIGCGNKESENDGAEIKMYISEPIYNFDPAEAYKNEAALKLVSLMFDNLFIMNDDGKVEKSLVKNYKIDKKENTMKYYQEELAKAIEQYNKRDRRFGGVKEEEDV